MSDPEESAGADSADTQPDRENEPDRENRGHQLDRLPATDAERAVAGRPTRAALLDWFAERFGIPATAFESLTFWEKGAGKIWVFAGEAPSPIRIEGLGMVIARTRQEHWKPTTNAAQRFGEHATRNVIDLHEEESARFVRGDDQEIAWDGDWGYLIAAHDLAGGRAPLGVGLYLHGELRSQVPKGRRRDR